MNSFLSLHILADGCNDTDIHRAGQFLDRCGCEYYNITLAARYNESEKIIRQIKSIAPHAKPIWRGWHSDILKDGDIWRKTTPQEWVNYRIAPNASWLQELGVYVLTCNEVGVMGADARIWSVWEATCIKLAWEQFQVRLAVLRFSTGNPLDTEHENYNEVLRAAGIYQAIISPNQYTAVNGELSTNWHVGRHRWMWLQQDKLGVKHSPIVIGEYALAFFDNNNNPDPNKGAGAMGTNTEQYITVIKRDGVIYRADGVTACMYVHGHWQEGGGSFDVHQDEPLLTALETEAKAGNLSLQPIPPALPVTKKDIVYGQKYRIGTPGQIINAYAAPSISDRRLGTIPDAAVVEVGNKVTVDRETWLQVRYPAFSGWGWIKIDLVDLRETVTMPVVNIGSDTEPETPTVKPDEPPVNATDDVKPSTSANGENAQIGLVGRNSAIVEQLKIIRGAIDTLITLLEVQEPIKA